MCFGTDPHWPAESVMYFFFYWCKHPYVLQVALRCLLPAGGAVLREGRLNTSLPGDLNRESSSLGWFSEELEPAGGEVCVLRAFAEPTNNKSKSLGES